MNDWIILWSRFFECWLILNYVGGNYRQGCWLGFVMLVLRALEFVVG